MNPFAFIEYINVLSINPLIYILCYMRNLKEELVETIKKFQKDQINEWRSIGLTEQQIDDKVRAIIEENSKRPPSGDTESKGGYPNLGLRLEP
jgi:hypothetical protein